MNGEEQARRMMALRVAQSSWTVAGVLPRQIWLPRRLVHCLGGLKYLGPTGLRGIDAVVKSIDISLDIHNSCQKNVFLGSARERRQKLTASASQHTHLNAVMSVQEHI